MHQQKKNEEKKEKDQVMRLCDITALFTPEPLLDCQKLWYAHMRQGGEPPQVVFNWNWTGTSFAPLVEDYDVHVINADCLCTSKTFTEKVFAQVYGYGSQATGGLAVAKRDDVNGAKDAHLVNLDHQGPQPGYFYQRPLTDPTRGLAMEYRWVVMGYRVVMGFAKTKRISPEDIAGTVQSYQLLGPSGDPRLEAFCLAAGMEYGELDCLVHQGRQYIIDMNPTPGDAAYHKMPPHQAREFQKQYNEHLLQWLLKLVS